MHQKLIDVLVKKGDIMIKRYYSWLSVSLLLLSTISYGNSWNDFTDWLSQLRHSAGSCAIPFCRRRVAVNCSLELSSKPITLNDFREVVAEKMKDVGQDIKGGAVIARDLGKKLFTYVQEKPVNAAIIGSGLILTVLLTRYLIHKIIDPAECPQCGMRRHKANHAYRL
jgi:hypothetical protein